MRKLIILLILLMSGGCTFRRAAPPRCVQNIVVEFESEVTGSEEAFALYCVDYILTVWKKDHNVTPRSGVIRISHRPRVYWGQREIGIPPWSDDPWFTIKNGGQTALGFYIARYRLMYIVAGRWGTAPSLYHELCHMNFAPRDVKHVDKRWPRWRKRGRQIETTLRKKRYEWYESGKIDELNRLAERAAKKSRRKPVPKHLH